MKKLIIFLCLITLFVLSKAQDINNVQLKHMHLEHGRKEIRIPNIMGYQTLKCDFHMHTVFSDGIVWPTVRVQEAWEEGLDAIAISDHIENQPFKEYVHGDHNASYNVSKEKADNMGLILIRGAEITRDMPPGHFNALFLEDANLLDTETSMQAIEAAARQNAFIEWNHPGWKAQQPDTCKWFPMHEEIFQKGWMHGIEVFNEKEWYPIALDWCMDKDITPLGNSDIHDVNAHYYDVVHGHRPMTLVFTTERSRDAIKEALFAKRTVAYFDNKLAGKKEFLEAIFKAAISIEKIREDTDKKKVIYAVKNNSDIGFHTVENDGRKKTLLANRTVLLEFPLGITEYNVKIENLYIRSSKNLEVSLQL